MYATQPQQAGDKLVGKKRRSPEEADNLQLGEKFLKKDPPGHPDADQDEDFTQT